MTRTNFFKPPRPSTKFGRGSLPHVKIIGRKNNYGRNKETNWTKLDNASKYFPAVASNNKDTLRYLRLAWNCMEEVRILLCFKQASRPMDYGKFFLYLSQF